MKRIWLVLITLLLIGSTSGNASQKIYTEYLKVLPNTKDKIAVKIAAKEKTGPQKDLCGCKKRNIRDFKTDSAGYTYAATNKGLLVIAPNASEKNKYSFLVNLVRWTIKAIKSLASLIGWDSLADLAGRVVNGDNGCLLINGKEGLPYEDLTSLDINSNGDILLGSAKGVILFSSGKFLYFGSKRWLDNDQIEKAVFVNGNIVAQTEAGVSKIKIFNNTLEAKEKYFDSELHKRFLRRNFEDGRWFTFQESPYRGRLTVSDNDGLWNGLYIAAQSFKYAATKDPKAKKRATEAMRGLHFLRKVTGKPGFFARSALRKNENLEHDWEDGEWHPSSVYPGWFWKGNTSFSEITGHFFAYGIYYDLVANQKEKQELAIQVNSIIDHLIANNFQLIDVDNEPTTWAKANPNDIYKKPFYYLSRGPTAIRLLAILNVATHITKRPDIQAIYEELAAEQQHALNTFNGRLTVHHSNKQIRWLSYFNLVRLEKNLDLKRLYLISLNRYWNFFHEEKSSLFNFIYGAVSGNTCNTSAAIQMLQETPLDLRRVRMYNSHRTDIKVIEKKKRGRKIFVTDQAISPRERGIMRWNYNPFDLDAGDHWREDELPPTFWMLPYWMGKYYKLI